MITTATWLTPLPDHARGSIVNYGDASLLRDQAEWRGYDLVGHGGIAVMSPADLGQWFWLRPSGEHLWHGPYLAVDVSRRDDFCHNAGIIGEVAEIDRVTLHSWGAESVLFDVEILRDGGLITTAPPRYRDVIRWRYVPEGEYDPSPRPFRSPIQEQRIGTQRPVRQLHAERQNPNKSTDEFGPTR